MSRIVLITNADDFGLDSSINEAVEKSFLCGTLTSASLMVGMPKTDEAARIARRHRGLGLGLHFNITQGCSVSDQRGSTLTTPSGEFRYRTGLERRATLRRFAAADVERELRAQLDAARVLEVEIDHIDGHQHVHVLPGIFDVVMRVAREQGLAVRIPHHRFIRRGPVNRQVCMKFLRRSLLQTAMRLSGAARPPADLLINDQFRCFFDLAPRPRTFGMAEAELLLDSLEPGITEWMLHPSPRPAAGEEGTPLGRLRSQEYALLTSWDLAERLMNAHDVVLASYDEVRSGVLAARMDSMPAAGEATQGADADSTESAGAGASPSVVMPMAGPGSTDPSNLTPESSSDADDREDERRVA